MNLVYSDADRKGVFSQTTTNKSSNVNNQDIQSENLKMITKSNFFLNPAPDELGLDIVQAEPMDNHATKTFGADSSMQGVDSVGPVIKPSAQGGGLGFKLASLMLS